MTILDSKIKRNMIWGVGFVAAVTGIYLLNHFISQDITDTIQPSAVLQTSSPETQTFPQQAVRQSPEREPVSPTEQGQADPEQVAPSHEPSPQESSTGVVYEAPLKDVILIQ